MDFLFLLAVVAVAGGAIWTLTRKRKSSGNVVGGGSPLPEEPKGPINEA